jgi:DNA polymerase III sliding clamp (beta) subunit (PCNA family)
MAFAVRAGEIKRIVKAIAQIGGGRRALMPDILQNYMRIKQDNGTAILEARTGNVYIKSRLSVLPTPDDTELQVLAPKKALKDLISTYNDDSILSFKHVKNNGTNRGQVQQVQAEQYEGQLLVQSNDTSKYSIKCALPEDWSGLNAESDGERIEFSMPASLLISGIQKVAFAAAQEDVRESLNGINFNIGGNKIRLIGTDAVTLAMCLIEQVDTAITTSISFTLPNETVEIIKNFFNDKEQNTIKITLIHDNDKQLRMVGFSDDQNSIYSYVINYPFPPVDGILKPESEYNVLVVNKARIMEVIKRFHKIADNKEQAFRINIKGNMMTLIQNSYSFGEGLEVVEIEKWAGDEIELSLSVNRISEILSNITSVEEIRIGIQAPNRPVAVFYDDEENRSHIQILVMPVVQ